MHRKKSSHSAACRPHWLRLLKCIYQTIFFLNAIAPVPVAPVHETDMVLWPKGRHVLKQMAKEVGLDLRGAYLNLDGGFDSAHNRKCLFNAGLIPN